MYRDEDSGERSVYREAWDDDYADDDYEDDDDYDDGYAVVAWDDASRALVVVDGTQDGAPIERLPPLIIPGGGVLAAAPSPRTRRKRPASMQFFVAAVSVCIIVSALFSIGVVGDTNPSQDADPFTLIANAFISAKSTALYHLYVAQPGDTFDSIAAKFGVQVNGIFELNALYLDSYAVAGKSYKIPYDPTYGRDFQPRYPPGVNPTGRLAPEQDVIIKATQASQFTAAAGKTNPANYCPAGWGAWGGNPALYQFINFDLPKTGKYTSVITQRFWSGHDGLDVSTGAYGTPVYAAQLGTVIFAGWDIGGGGWTIKIAHCGYVATSYAHLVPGSMRVKAGDQVTQGELIGQQGQSGMAYGAHVHFMMWWQNIPIDGLCGYPNGLDGHTVAGEGSIQFNGCPPNLVSMNPFGWG
jgi:murein DD-endopeptidase MepM/ murein hydrolase activator NlpD